MLSFFSCPLPLLLSVVSVVLCEDVLSHKMTVGQSSSLELGQPYSIWCTVDEAVEALETCAWRHEMDGELHVEDGVVLDDDNNEVAGITVNNTDPRYYFIGEFHDKMCRYINVKVLLYHTGVSDRAGSWHLDV